MKAGVAIIGSGNIGTDLMFKVMRLSQTLRMVALVGIDPESDGLARAKRMGVATTHEGVDGLLKMPEYGEVEVVFDATSAKAHLRNAQLLRDKIVVDMTPAAIGPYVIPPVNLDEHMAARNVNMVSCGGQATVPIVAAVGRATPVSYGEIVASISSRSAGPGTRQNIDEFTVTTARAIEVVGGAQKGKAIIVLNPAEPPMIMRDTVYCLCPDLDADQAAIAKSVQDMVSAVQEYVPGYRLKQEVQFDQGPDGLQVSVFLEVSGAGHYLPEYAGNLDIMTSAALRTGERLWELRK
jgi:acetaldehyde dehydrogenase